MKTLMLFLDDMQERQDLVQKGAPDFIQIVPAYTANSAIELLKHSEEPYHIISLDHDLGFGHGLPDDAAPTGMVVVDYLCTSLVKERRPKVVIVHTWNIPASELMESKLREAGYLVIRQPFKGWL